MAGDFGLLDEDEEIADSFLDPEDENIDLDEYPLEDEGDTDD